MRKISTLAAAATVCALTACAHTPSTASSSLAPEQVRIVQRALTAQGHPVALTGTWDQPTETALRSFQGSHDLPATGTMDRATAEALGVDPNSVKPVVNTDGYLHPFNPNNPEVNCAVNNTVDCRPAGGP